MKKITIVFSLALLIGAVSCNNTKQQGNGSSTNPETNAVELVKPSSLADYDMVIMEDGNLVFYSDAANLKTPYTAETDSVVNAVYDSNNTLYYSVCVDGNLFLRSLKLDDTDPKPVELADWNLTRDECMGLAILPMDNLVLNEDETKVGIYSESVMFITFSKLSQYDTKTGEVTKITLVDFDPETGALENYYGSPDFVVKTQEGVNTQLFEDDEHGSLYYLGDKNGRVCISDRLNYPTLFDVEPDELVDEYIINEPISISPAQPKVLFSSSLPWGDYGIGSYCVANLDGSQQYDLNSDIFYPKPQWLKDGSLVYYHDNGGDFLDDNYQLELRLMSADGKTRRLSNSANYTVKPY